jgi:hypothetical protein
MATRFRPLLSTLRADRRLADMARPLVVVLACMLGGPALAAPAVQAAAPLTSSVVGEDPQGNGVFRFPQAVAVSDAGNRVFVGDQYSGVVQAFDGQGRHLFNIGARATRKEPGRFGVVGGVAVDRSGHLYVLDAENDRVQVFASATGQFLASWGDDSIFRLMSGVASTGVGISASGIAVFQAPGGPPVVYVADAGNDRVERFVLDPSTLQPVGAPQISDPAIGLDAPQGLTLDATGTSDRRPRCRRPHVPAAGRCLRHGPGSVPESVRRGDRLVRAAAPLRRR